MKIQFENRIEYDSRSSCEHEAMLVINDFLSERIDNDSIIFYPVDTEMPGHADFHVGIEKEINGKLFVDSAKIECKSAKYKYLDIKKNKTSYDGSIVFNAAQIQFNPKKLLVLVLKTDKHIDSIKIGYFNISDAVHKGIMENKDKEYRYKFNKEKSSAIKQDIFLNTKNGNKEKMLVLSTYNSGDIKDLVDFWNACNVKDRMDYLKVLTVTDLIQHTKADIYNELDYNSLENKVDKKNNLDK